MADKKNLFRQESLDRIESPEKLDQYIKVSNPGTWILILALLLVVLGAGIWAFTGSLPETIETQGLSMEDNQVVVYIEPSQTQEELVGKEVHLTLPDNSTVTGTVSSVSEVPVSFEEIAQDVDSQWILEEIVPEGYSYQVDIAADQNIPENYLVSATITVKDVKPIEYVLN